MKDAARALNFEYAAELRDEVNALRKMAPTSNVGQDTGTAGSAKTKPSTVQAKPQKAAKRRSRAAKYTAAEGNDN